MTNCNIVSWIGSHNGIKILAKNYKNWNKVLTLVNMSMFFNCGNPIILM